MQIQKHILCCTSSRDIYVVNLVQTYASGIQRCGFQKSYNLVVSWLVCLYFTPITCRQIYFKANSVCDLRAWHCCVGVKACQCPLRTQSICMCRWPTAHCMIVQMCVCVCVCTVDLSSKGQRISLLVAHTAFQREGWLQLVR